MPAHGGGMEIIVDILRIESTSNHIYKSTKKLLATGTRKKTRTFIIEGERIVRDAIKNGASVEYVILADDDISFDELKNIKTYQMPHKLFDTLKSTVNSQGILAVVRYTEADFDKIDFSAGGCYLYLDSVTDPGNMGTILRTADAFGISGVIISAGCVDVYNPKVLRSTMSGIFNIKLYFDEGTALDSFRKNGYKITGAFLDGTGIEQGIDYTEKSVVVMGNEANGISEEIEKFCDEKITIPMTGGAESLNVSVACGIILYDSFVYRKNLRNVR